LLDGLRNRYRIPAANFLGHGDVAPGRKVDPSRLFPWQRLAGQGFGLWCDAPPPSAPTGFDAMFGLQALGYDITAPAAARGAFRRHFLAADADAELGPGEQALLHCLLQRKTQRDPRPAMGPATPE
jgi:N-acetylmuramoyl-L-alanine amidase